MRYWPQFKKKKTTKLAVLGERESCAASTNHKPKAVLPVKTGLRTIPNSVRFQMQSQSFHHITFSGKSILSKCKTNRNRCLLHHCIRVVNNQEGENKERVPGFSSLSIASSTLPLWVPRPQAKPFRCAAKGNRLLPKCF